MQILPFYLFFFVDLQENVWRYQSRQLTSNLCNEFSMLKNWDTMLYFASIIRQLLSTEDD